MAEFDFKKDVNFGYLSAENERSEDEELILKGQIDLKEANEKALDGSEFLFLGYKGTGKSSLGEKLVLQAKGRYDRFVKLISLGEFPFKDFSKIIPGDSEKEAKLPVAWSWILLIYILDSFAKDAGAKHPEPDNVANTIVAFRALGFSEDAEPSYIIRTTSKKNFKVSVQLAEASYAPSGVKSRADIPDFANALKNFIAKFRSDNRHYLIIDGLDDILTGKDIQYQSLAALLSETQSLNQFFKKTNTPIKVILLCRTDIFDRISTPNKNKLNDYTFEFDWFHDPHRPSESFLIRAAELRASLVLPRGKFLFGGIFPVTFKGKETQKQLLDMTRHTPRDFLQLLKKIQSFSRNNKVDEAAILDGIRTYSKDYFIKEIRDELSGYSKPRYIDSVIEAFGRLREREFSFPKLRESVKGQLSDEELLDVRDALYNCSAIANIERRREDQNPFYSSKYQNRATRFNAGFNIILHKGLWKAFNIG